MKRSRHEPKVITVPTVPVARSVTLTGDQLRRIIDHVGCDCRLCHQARAIAERALADARGRPLEHVWGRRWSAEP